ncbi:MAG: hypothetical protein KAH18_02095 [Psychromonas sp.]|nr:hypothetical protein [Psychromonas sp.]
MQTQKGILARLDLHDPLVAIHTFDRLNIEYLLIKKYKAVIQLLNYFGQSSKLACANCNVYLNPAESYHATQDAQKILFSFIG